MADHLTAIIGAMARTLAVGAVYVLPVLPLVKWCALMENANYSAVKLVSLVESLANTLASILGAILCASKHIR